MSDPITPPPADQPTPPPSSGAVPPAGSQQPPVPPAAPAYGAPQAPQPGASPYGAPQPPQYGAPQPPHAGAPQYGAPQPPQPGAPQYGQTPQYTPAVPNAPFTPEQDKQWAGWAQLGGILGPIPPLIIWLIGKDRGQRTNFEGKESLNWQITLVIVMVGIAIASGILGTVFALARMYWLTDIFSWLPGALWVLNIVLCSIAFSKVNAGGSYRYPVNFRFIK